MYWVLVPYIPPTFRYLDLCLLSTNLLNYFSTKNIYFFFIFFYVHLIFSSIRALRHRQPIIFHRKKRIPKGIFVDKLSLLSRNITYGSYFRKTRIFLWILFFSYFNLSNKILGLNSLLKEEIIRKRGAKQATEVCSTVYCVLFT